MASNSNTQGDNSTNTQLNVVINAIILDSEQLGEALRGMMDEDFEASPNHFQVIANRGHAAFVNQGHPIPARAPSGSIVIPLLESSAGQRRAPQVVPEVPIFENDSMSPLPRDCPTTSSNRNVEKQLTGRKRTTNDHLEEIGPPVKMAPFVQNRKTAGVEGDAVEPRHRVMLVNYTTSDPLSCQFVNSKQDKYGYTFDITRSAPETNTLFICNNRYITHFTVNSDEEMEKIRRILDAEEAKNFGWIQKFCIQRMKNRNPFICPISMNEEELMKCSVVATKAYIEKGKGNEVGAMNLNETINSSEMLKNAINCSETMKEMQEGLSKKGKAILRKLIGKCSGGAN